jgi:pantoate--beta-alanine ligase
LQGLYFRKREILKNKYLCRYLRLQTRCCEFIFETHFPTFSIFTLLSDMLIFKRIVDLQKHLNTLRARGKQIGFAPTMGALHRGHVSLVERAKAECDVAVVSIFVNPTQFNDPKDLEKYPRTPERDIEMLAEGNCDILFYPSVEEIYPNGMTPSVKFNFGKLDKVLEGEFRPGHFDGMAQVVNRLLEIVQPSRLFMGQKDFQQAAIVAKLLELTNSKTQLVVCDILREDDGLAMSSRNVRLSPDARAKAPLIHQVLTEAADTVEEYTPVELQRIATTKLKLEPSFKVEYFEIVDGRTLKPLRLFEDTDFAVAVVAVWVGDVRLIDNKVLKRVIFESELDPEWGSVGSL